MGLKEYRKKRDFRRTPEPAGKEARSAAGDGGGLFVVQKHAASRLHYDFRLEMGGVLKSWAIPKGPSLDPREKRLAVQVEDHPLEYGEFEGVIPQGEYGGGTVLLWDRGRWFPEGDPERGLAQGDLKFRLEGKKLRGRWALVRMGGRSGEGGKNWLLIKKKDEAARLLEEGDILEERPESVKSGRSLEAIGSRPRAVWHSNAAAGDEKPERSLDPARLPGARKAPLPETIVPELATLAAAAPEGDDWLHEIKHDGYRILCRLDGRKTRLLSRRGQDWAERFGALGASISKLQAGKAFLDGEVVVELPDGTSSFQALQNSLGSGGRDLVYYVFDLLYLEGYDLRRSPLEERKALLRTLLSSAPPKGPLRYSDHVVGHGAEFFRQASSYALEGVVSKRRDSPYRSGRARDWLKIKCLKRQEFIIAGYTEPSGSRVGIGSLLLAVKDPKNGFLYAGRVGTGFTARSLEELQKRLKPLEQAASPLADPHRVPRDRKIHWAKPELVAEVQFTEWTRDGILRHPSFQGLREDKEAGEVVLERALPAGAGGPPAPVPGGSPAPGAPAVAAGSPETVAGVHLSHPDRIVYPEEGITKRGLAEYYLEAGERMLPLLAGRPLTLFRCPEGQGKPCFWQKHREGALPEAIRALPLREKEGKADYMTVDSLAGLISLVQMNVLEIHAWGAQGDQPDRPDRLVFDLDPDADLAWERVIEAALLVRGRLQDLGLESFVKTTGGKGLHVVVPLQKRQGWDEARGFSQALAESIVRESPRLYTASPSRAARRGKIFLDYLRNVRGATSVAAYSTRARPRAPVSTPLRWDELSSGVHSDHYTVLNLPRRLSSLKEDPWRGFKEARQWITSRMLRELAAGRRPHVTT